jgi:murein DD-endopeptidase MepM/ murein hydrolase activator NlpD
LHFGRRGRAGVFAVVLCTLLLPAVASSAGPQEELEGTQERLEQIRDQLDAKQAVAGSVKDEISALESAISELQMIINRLDAGIARVKSDVRDARVQIELTQERMMSVEKKATEQAVALYKAGGTDVLTVLLESKSLAELDERAEMLGIAARENTGELIEYGRLKVAIQQQYQRLFAKQKELSAQLEARSSALAQMSAHKEKLRSRYARLDDDIGHLQDKEGDLAAEAEKLRGEILAAQAAAQVGVAAVQSSGMSGSGFIWPLNGPVTSGYGPRWGSMHTGIDIDGYTGQPVVASKGGRVIQASYYGGYGNAVIIDHGGGVATLYAHMSAFSVSGGQGVSQGEVVGSVGCTGSCTGDHLHFEVRLNGGPVDPMGYLP